MVCFRYIIVNTLQKGGNKGGGGGDDDDDDNNNLANMELGHLMTCSSLTHV